MSIPYASPSSTIMIFEPLFSLSFGTMYATPAFACVELIGTTRKKSFSGFWPLAPVARVSFVAEPET